MRRSNSSMRREQLGACTIAVRVLLDCEGGTIDPILPPYKPTKSLKKGGKAMQSSRPVSANDIEIFLTEQGQGPLVLLCHGWPELSYSWRHQIPAIADAGFHVVAPDMRGFGRTSAPLDIGAYSIFDNVGDMVALVAAPGEKQAVIVGHDW